MPGVLNPILDPVSCQTISNFLELSHWNLAIVLSALAGAPLSKVDRPSELMRSLSTGVVVPVPSGVVANTNDAGPSLVAKV